ncbi:TspO/MBR family protein [Chloroflexota bacterium]
MEDGKLKYVYKLIISIVACQFAGFIGSIFTTSAIPTWYAAIEKPAFTPPNWLFAPAWITLYVLMAIAASIVWQRGLGDKQVRAGLIIFLVQLILNALWSVVFFGLESLLYGIVVIVALWIAILLTTIKFLRISNLAGSLLLPYIGWVTFAVLLTVSIYFLNT